MNPECIFCKIIDGSIPSQKIYETKDVLVFLDIRPLNPGHCLLIPKHHADNILETSEQDVIALMSVVKKIMPVLLKTVGADAFNLSSNCGRAAGQIVFHTHVHLIPRLPADGYKHWQREDDLHDDLQAMAEKIRRALEDAKA